jgi:hypothetical protein
MGDIMSGILNIVTFLLCVHGVISLGAMEKMPQIAGPTPFGILEKDQSETTDPFELIPLEIKLHIIKFLEEAPGITKHDQLRAAAQNMRNFLYVTRELQEFLNDPGFNAILIQALAQRYTFGNIVAAAAALHTQRAGEGLVEFIKTFPDQEDMLIEALTRATQAEMNFILSYFPSLLTSEEKRRKIVTQAIVEANSLVVQKFLDAGADASMIITSMYPPLHLNAKLINYSLLMLAVRLQRTDIVTLLLNAHADINYQSPDGNSALILATLNHNPSIIEQLLEKGADASVSLSMGFAPIHIAARMGKTAALQIFLQNTSLINAPNATGQTALMLAAGHDQIGIVWILLKAGADINCKDQAGYDAVYYAHHTTTAELRTAIAELIINYPSRACEEYYSQHFKYLSEKI